MLITKQQIDKKRIPIHLGFWQYGFNTTYPLFLHGFHPGFFSVLKQDGPKYLALAIVVAAVGLGSGVDLPINGFITLQRGDRLQVTGEESRLEELAKSIGYVEEDIEETDLLTFAGTIMAML